MATLNNAPASPACLYAALVCAVALCLSPAVAAAQEPSPYGPWACQHQKPDGTITKDCVVVVELNGESYLVKWQVEGNAWEGTGVLQAGHFAVAFVDTKKNVFGIALYKYALDEHGFGSWVGHWSVSGNPRLWSEVWTIP